MKVSPVNMANRAKLDLRVGDTVKVFQKIEEKGKVRLQPFEGLVLARKHGTEPGATFTVRRSTGGYGVEKIFPLYSPVIDKIEVLKRSKVRRSKLYNIRRQALKQISKRMKMMFVDIKTEEEKEDTESGEEKVENENALEAETKSEEESPKEGTLNQASQDEVRSGKEEAPAEKSKEEPAPSEAEKEKSE